MQSDPRAQLLDQYRTALQNYVFEGQVYWTRITVFVLLNSALLVARSALPLGPEDRWVRLSIALLGLIATVLWAHTAIRAHYLRRFWLTMMRDLEERLEMGPLAPFLAREDFVTRGFANLPRAGLVRLPWLARGSLDDSSSAVLTAVFLVIWLVAIVRLV